VVAAVLAPLGLAAAPLAVMRAGIAWILGVAEIVADWEGAVIPVTQPAGAALPLLACGALFALLWRGRFRWAGLAPVAAAAMLWAGAERPALLVSEGGGLWGAMGPEGRALSRARGEGFAALSWLENDGDPATQEIAAARDGPPALRLRVLEGEVSPPALAAACASADVVLAPASRPAAAAVPADCLLIDRAVLARRGAVAVHRGAEGPRLVAAERPGARPWSRRPQ
jgi:competence protein ComEC